MDMRLNPDGEYKWILQIKCHFSRYVWLSALKDKGSEGVAIVFSTWLAFNGLCRIVQCDNGTEFKGALRQKCQEYGIKMIRGRPYHPETQGSVERANGTYKQRLRAYILEKGGNNWMQSLGDIARVINTTPTSVLPRHVTPFEVFFGRKPRFDKYMPTYADSDTSSEHSLHSSLSGENGCSDNNSDTDESIPEETEEDITAILTALEQRVFKKNIKISAGYAKRGGLSTAVFKIGDIVTLAVEKKRRVVGEPLRLPCRIVDVEGEKYSLLSAIGWLSGWFTGNQLNETRGAMVSTNIPLLPLGSKRISLAAAFKELYNRPSITALQSKIKGKGETKQLVWREITGMFKLTKAGIKLTATDTEAMIEEEGIEVVDTMEEEEDQEQAPEDIIQVRVPEAEQLPLTPRNRRKRVRYSPSPVQQQRRKGRRH
jgi:hypothetical protein